MQEKTLISSLQTIPRALQQQPQIAGQKCLTIVKWNQGQRVTNPRHFRLLEVGDLSAAP